jgi:hypothetical protein
MIQLHASGNLTSAQSVYFVQPRPREELYDCVNDPHEIHNLVADKTHHAALTRLRKALDHWEATTGDRVPDLPTADEFDRSTGLPTDARIRPRPSKAEMVRRGLTAP